MNTIFKISVIAAITILVACGAEQEVIVEPNEVCTPITETCDWRPIETETEAT